MSNIVPLNPINKVVLVLIFFPAALWTLLMYRKSGNFRVKKFHAIIFRLKIFSYASRPYENILTTKIFQ